MTAASPSSPSTPVSNTAASTTVKTAHNFEITCPLPLTKGNSKNLNLPSQLTPINRRRRVSVEVHEIALNKSAAQPTAITADNAAADNIHKTEI
eukprot:scaffold25295_cov153-Skeletonema_marinoi.AAC.1